MAGNQGNPTLMKIKSAKKEATAKAKEWLNSKPLYLDSETTGLGNDAEIVDICIIDWDGNVLLNTLVRPRKRIPSDATAIHGITNSMVKNAPIWKDIWNQVHNVLANRILGIYNEEYDLRLMKQSCLINDLSWSPPYSNSFCIMKLYAAYYGVWNDYHKNFTFQSLKNAGKQCSIDIVNTHRAQDDTFLSRAVLFHIAGADGSIRRGGLSDSDIIISETKSREELELERKRKILATLEELLAEKETELISFRTEINSFQNLYLGVVGVKLAELDEINAKIAEFLAKRLPKDASAGKKAKEARKQAESSRHAYDFIEFDKDSEKVTPSDELNKIFYDIAKQCHPDFANDEEDRLVRDEFMKLVNEAYESRDLERLKSLQNEWGYRPENIIEESIADELDRISMKIALIENRIAEYEGELIQLHSSDYSELMKEWKIASKDGRELFEELNSQIEEKILVKKAELEKLKNE